MTRRFVMLGALALAAIMGGGIYYLFNRSIETVSPPQQGTEQPLLPTFPERIEPVGSGGQPSIRWTLPYEGNWENPDNWIIEATGTHRLPNPDDDVIIPERIGTRTVRVVITDAVTKRLRNLINHGTIRGGISENNPSGSVSFEVEQGLFNDGRIESANTKGDEPSAVVLKVGRLRNEYIIEAGTSEGEDQAGGRIDIEAEVFENKDEVSAGNALAGPGGSVSTRVRLLHNAGRIHGGRGGQHAKSPPSPGGDVFLTATEELDQYDGDIEGGTSLAGRGGSIQLHAGKAHHLGGSIRAGKGKEEGSIAITAQKLFLMAGAKSIIAGHHIELRAPQISLNGLAFKGIQARSTESSVAGIQITACERLNLSNNSEKLVLNVPQGGAIHFEVPNSQAILLDKDVTLESLAFPVPMIELLSETCP